MENTITIDCNAPFLDVLQTINSDPHIFENFGKGDYRLSANVEVAGVSPLKGLQMVMVRDT